MGNCKDCKHWREPKNLYAFLDLHTDDGFGSCNRHEDSSEPHEPVILSSYEDVVMLTKPNFGCNEWEANDER